MFIVGENLKQLTKQYKIVNDIRDVDETCIELKLFSVIKRLVLPQNTSKNNHILKYGDSIPREYIKKEKIYDRGLKIPSKGCVLACSSQVVHIPRGYMGLVQTKGTLARMFMFAQCSDAQIDSGYKGRITFELFNASPFDIVLRAEQSVANLYILSASDKKVNEYEGKYSRAMEPTVPRYK